MAGRQIIPIRVEPKWQACDPETGEDVPVVKKVLTILVIAFAAYYLLTAPSSAADAVSGAFSAVADGFEALITFFTELF